MISNNEVTDALPCYMVNNVTINSAEQCKFIVDNGCLEDESTIDYVYLVYCEMGYELRYAAIVMIAFFVIVLFLNLSSVADEFLCPSLLSVAKNLRMSDSLAGVTLLAFGNGCPDIFASIAAASSGRAELIVGELLGAGIFCTSIVAGLIFIHSDFKLAARPLLRDAVFYLLAVYLMWYYCWDEEISFYGSLCFIIIYVIYLIVALSGQAIHSRQQGCYAITEARSEVALLEKKESNENWFRCRDESLRIKQSKHKDAPSNTTKLKPNVHINYTNGITSIHLGPDSAKPTGREVSIPLDFQLYSSVNGKDSKNGFINQTFASEDDSPSSERLETHTAQYKPVYSQSVMKLGATTVSHCKASLTLNEWDDFLAHINPIDWDSWRESGIIGKAMQVLRSPLLFLAIITVPVVDRDKKLSNWCRLLNSLHCITVPLFLIMATKSDENIRLFGVPIKVILLLPGLILALTLFLTTTAQRAPKFHSSLAYFGFIMSILWIYLLAKEIISLLKTVGIIFSMTDTAIGLGVLAWGNSLGDIVANVSLADAGYPRMALGASIGAPLLNLLLGYGLAFTLSLRPGQFSPIEYSPTISLLCSTLAIILIALMLSTLVPPERSRKPFGYLLICGYAVYFALAVCFETGLIKVG